MARYLYLAPLVGFLADIDSGTLVPTLARRHVELADRSPKEAEITSWKLSLPALADVLRDPAFATGEVFVELFMPLNGKRCDVLLTGHVATGASAVIVELKQWSFVAASHLPEHVYGGGRNVLHPSVQVRDYVETMRHYHGAFTGPGEPIALHGVAFLHDLRMDHDKAGLREPSRFGTLPLDFPLFYAHEQRVLARWLAARLVPGPGKPVADRIRKGAPLPSPKLLDRVVACIKGQDDWKLLDEQKTAYFTIRHAVQIAKDTGQKQVFVVRGGPGTGKSVLAIQLLADAARQGWTVVHATGSKAFQTVLQGRTEAFSKAMLQSIHNVRTKKAMPVGHLFTTFADVAKLGAAEADRLDLCVCDEAHRLWEHRRQKFPNGKVRWLSETSMIDEVIAASRVTVFFLDDDQSVRAGEIGSSARIVERTRVLDIPHEIHDLDAQFRCAGSTSYIRWVEGMLDFRDGLSHEWQAEGVYEARVWEDMVALDDYLRRLGTEGQRCRLVAGYCWRWSKPDALGKLPHDLVDPRFGDWSGAWIEKTGKDLKPLDHQYYRWATREEAYEQVGSIYSVQGFEFDAIGVIWGEDLVWRGNRWVAQLDRNRDGAFKRELRDGTADPVVKLRNVYRVLLTRGMRSTHLFVLDEETRAHVKACLETRSEALRLVAGAREPMLPMSSPSRSASVVAGGSRARAFAPIAVDPPADAPWAVAVPLLDFHAAAGGFSGDWHDLVDLREATTWVTWDGAPTFHPGEFVAQVRGDSMAPMIADADWCLFKPAPIEQAVGRPALVRLAADATTGGRFTVKVVGVEWSPAPDGTLVRTALILSSINPGYPPLRIDASGQAEVAVLAVLERVLGPWR